VYVYVWEFDVAEGRTAEFEEIYGPEGAWVALFRRASGYRATRLVRSAEHRRRYFTVDEWDSKAGYDAFRRQFANEFEALDRRCESLTVSEQLRLSVDGTDVDRTTST